MPKASSSSSAAPLLPSLEQSLHRLTIDELKWYVALLPGKAPTRKGELVAMLTNALTDPEQVRQFWLALDSRQQEMIADVVHTRDGLYYPDQMQSKYPGVRMPTGPQPYYNSFLRNTKKKEATAFDLLFLYSPEVGHHIPREVAALLHTLTVPPPPSQIRSSEQPPIVETPPGQMDRSIEVILLDTQGAVFHDLAATLSTIHEGKISVSATTKLPALTSVRVLRERLLIGDYFAGVEYERAEDAMRPLALVMLVQAVGWAAPAGAKGAKLELTTSGQALLGKPLQADHVRKAWERWLKSDLLDELSRVRSIKGQQSKDARLTRPAQRREKMVAVLKYCPVGRWVEFDEFLRYMRAEGQLPDIERNVPTALYVGSTFEYGWLGFMGVRYWDVVTGSYLRAAIWEYAATLGLVDIAYTRPEESPHDFGGIYGLDKYEYLSRYDGLLALRLTPLGAYVLGLAESYTPSAETIEPGPPVLKVLPNLDVVVTDASRLTPNDKILLGRIGSVVSESVYHLDRDKFLDAIREGLAISHVQDFLANRGGVSARELPQTVRVFFSDLEKRLNAVREAGRMLVLEGDDPMLLTELAYSGQLREVVRLGKIGEQTVLLVPENEEATVRKHLKKLGYVPLRR